MAIDTIERLDDLIILRHRPGLRVWCHPDGAPIVTELDTGQRVIWCWSGDSTAEQRDQTRQALIRGGWRGLAEVAIGDVQPGEVERWARNGYLVVMDAPAANRHMVVGIELEGEHGARLGRRRRRRRQVDAAIALVSGGSDEGCSHPADERVDLTEMGGPIRYLCRACGQEVTLTT